MSQTTALSDSYRRGESRGRLLADRIVEDARQRGPEPTLLDIGCGQGFDGSQRWQRHLAWHSGAYIGVDPDAPPSAADFFTEIHGCPFEAAPLPPESVDVAFAVMVLEHLADPRVFWDKLFRVLRAGGVFWGLTIDRRHWFSAGSLLAERFRFKNLYLDWLRGRRGQDRYKNYPVYYRSNTPEQITRLTPGFRKREFFSLTRVGQCDYYFPRAIVPLVNCLERLSLRKGKPGMLLAMRLEK